MAFVGMFAVKAAPSQTHHVQPLRVLARQWKEGNENFPENYGHRRRMPVPNPYSQKQDVADTWTDVWQMSKC